MFTSLQEWWQHRSKLKQISKELEEVVELRSIGAKTALGSETERAAHEDLNRRHIALVVEKRSLQRKQPRLRRRRKN